VEQEVDEMAVIAALSGISRRRALENVPQQDVKPRPLYDRLQTFRYGVTRNRAAAAIAFVSGILFISSGYKANIAIYNLIESQIIAIDGLRDFWQYLITPILVLVLAVRYLTMKLMLLTPITLALETMNKSMRSIKQKENINENPDHEIFTLLL
jgi:hypothetical protein